MNELLTTQQLAWVLGRSTGTIRDQIKAGEIEATRIVGGYRIPKPEVLRVGAIEQDSNRVAGHPGRVDLSPDRRGKAGTDRHHRPRGSIVWLKCSHVLVRLQPTGMDRRPRTRRKSCSF